MKIYFEELINNIIILGKINKDKILKEFINKINEKYYFIQTIEREELLEYISSFLSANSIIDDNDIIDKYRDW